MIGSSLKVADMTSDNTPKIVLTNATERLYRNVDRIHLLPKISDGSKLIANMLEGVLVEARNRKFITIRFALDITEELRAVEIELRNSTIDAPEEEWRNVLRSIDDAMRAMVNSPEMHLSSLNQYINDNIVSHLKFYSRQLPKTEVFIPSSDVADVRRCLDSLAAASGDANVPPSIRATIDDLLSQFQAALRAYAARGGRALSDVMLVAADSLYRHRAELIEHEDEPVVRSLGALWIELLRVTKPIRDAHSVVGLVVAGGETAVALADLVPHVVKLITKQ
jgi:hypothetical protein